MTQKIHAKMAAILAEFPAVTKDKKNPSQGYQYRGIDDALRELNPLLSKHGVYIQLVDLVPTFTDAGQTRSGTQQVRCVVVGKVRFVAGEDGSATECSLIGEGIDMGDKAMMKAQANGLKYVLWYTFCVPTDEKKDSEAFEDPGTGGGSSDSGSAPAKRGGRRAAPALKSGTGGNGSQPPLDSAPPTADAGDGAAILALIQGCKDKEDWMGIRGEVRSWVQAQSPDSPARKRVVDVFVQRQTELDK